MSSFFNVKPFNAHKSEEILPRVVSSSGLGYLTAATLISVNPMHAAIFHATAEITNLLVYKLMQKHLGMKPKVGYAISTTLAYVVAFFGVHYYAQLALAQAVASIALTAISQLALSAIYQNSLVLGSATVLAGFFTD